MFLEDIENSRTKLTSYQRVVLSDIMKVSVEDFEIIERIAIEHRFMISEVKDIYLKMGKSEEKTIDTLLEKRIISDLNENHPLVKMWQKLDMTDIPGVTVADYEVITKIASENIYSIESVTGVYLNMGKSEEKTREALLDFRKMIGRC